MFHLGETVLIRIKIKLLLLGYRYYIIDVISLENEKEMHLLRFDSQTQEEKIVIPDFFEVLSEVSGEVKKT